MRTEKIFFTNQTGHKLAAKLELPNNQAPHSYALFAHCFTCNKNLTAVRNIAKALTRAGFAVLRFDFTGLGESEGTFEDTNFSSNIEDLIAASDHLSQNYAPPSILIGHSLGGAAVICASILIPSVKAVATIGAPFDPRHVSHHFSTKLEEIQQEGVAEVRIGGRPFKVKKQFLEDIESASLKRKLNELNRALLIMHAPQDQIVEIENASQIYQYAQHPKSFITLDGADHLLTNPLDSEYAGLTIANWAKRYVALPDKPALKQKKAVTVHLDQASGFTTNVKVRHHEFLADEPATIGGNDYGPTPYDLVSAGLGACTAMTLHLYARRKKWDLQAVQVDIDHFKDYAKDCEACEDNKSKIDHFEKVIHLKGNLDSKQRERLLEIAERCPVHRTLTNEVAITSQLE